MTRDVLQASAYQEKKGLATLSPGPSEELTTPSIDSSLPSVEEGTDWPVPSSTLAGESKESDLATDVDDGKPVDSIRWVFKAGWYRPKLSDGSDRLLSA